MNFTELPNGSYEGYVLVKSVEKKTAKTGKDYLDFVLSDKTGEIVAKMWNNVPADMPFKENSIIKVRGKLGEYNNAPQFTVDMARNIDERDDVDINDFVASSEYTGEYMFDTLRGIVEKFKDEDLKKITLAIMDEYREDLLVWPAAFRLHHAIRGGLLYHTLSIVKISEYIAALYPTVDRELLISGAILHDVAKIFELTLNDAGLVEKYSLEGRLIGHLVKGAMLVEKFGTELNIDRMTVILLEHMLISHHGEPEFGAAIRPLFLEAEILSSLDSLDAKIYEIITATQDIEVGEFSARRWALDNRHLLNHGRKPIEPIANL